MNFQEMIQREDFPKVILETIQCYFRVKNNINIEISDLPRDDSTELLLFYRPLLLSSKRIPKGGRQLLYGEYNIRGSLIKYIVAKAGIFWMTHFSKAFPNKKYYISPQVDLQNIYICPCNRSVRFYNFELDTVDCFLKTGFSSEYMDHQLDFRMKNNYTFVPPVIDRGDNWYSERIMHGHALARVRNQADHDKATQTAIDDLETLAKDTFQIMPVTDYLLHLKKTLNLILSTLYCDKFSSALDTIEEFARDLEGRINEHPLDIPICTSHGDLQEGNIWLENNGGVLIYDWETVGTRSVWYDPLTLYFGLHNKPYSEEIISFLKQDKRFLVFDPKKNYTNNELSSILYIILYEDMIFQLTEATQLVGEYKQIRTETITENIRKSSYWRNR